MPYEYLGWFKNSNVTLVADLITDLNISDLVRRLSAKPNHSVLSWEFQLSTYKTMDKQQIVKAEVSWLLIGHITCSI